MHTHFSRVMIVLVLVHAGGSVGYAQEVAGSFDQLRVLVKPGDKVTVTDDAGRETTGRIAELSSSSLALIADGERRDLQATQVNTIRQRRSDSLANGAKWGFGIGAGLGLLGGLAIATEYDEDGDGEETAFVVAATLVYGAMGAGAGVGIDALISSNQIIYARRTSARFSVKPLLTRQRQGAVVVLGF